VDFRSCLYRPLSPGSPLGSLCTRFGVRGTTYIFGFAVHPISVLYAIRIRARKRRRSDGLSDERANQNGMWLPAPNAVQRLSNGFLERAGR